MGLDIFLFLRVGSFPFRIIAQKVSFEHSNLLHLQHFNLLHLNHYSWVPCLYMSVYIANSVRGARQLLQIVSEKFPY